MASPPPIAPTDDGALPVRPWRSLLICAALVALTVAVFRDLGLTDPRSIADAAQDVSQTVRSWVSEPVAPPVPDIPTAPPPETADAADIALPEPLAQPGPAILTRTLADPVRLIFAAGCLAVILFVAVQLICLGIDVRLVLRHEARAGVLTPFAQLARGLAARRLRPGQPEQRRLDAFDLAAEGDVIADPLRLGLTGFPMLGFLGTVVGLSGAIEALPGAIGNPDALQPVLSELHVAFDTTLFGLIGALICLVGAKAIDQGWDRLSRRAGLE